MAHVGGQDLTKTNQNFHKDINLRSFDKRQAPAQPYPDINMQGGRLTVLQGRSNATTPQIRDKSEDEEESFDSLGGVLVKGMLPASDSMAVLPEEVYLRSMHASRFPQDLAPHYECSDESFDSSDDGRTPNDYLD